MAKSREKLKADLRAYVLTHFPTSHMNNAKWMKLFLLLAESHVQRVPCKRIGNDFILHEVVPQREQVYTTHLEDAAIGGGPLEYDEIVWIELPYHTVMLPQYLQSHAQFAIDQFLAQLQHQGRFAIIRGETSVRIYGYS